MPKDNAGANKNLMLLTRNTISILKNPDKIKLFYIYIQRSNLLNVAAESLIFLNNFRYRNITLFAHKQGRRHHQDPEQYTPVP